MHLVSDEAGADTTRTDMPLVEPLNPDDRSVDVLSFIPAFAVDTHLTPKPPLDATT